MNEKRFEVLFYGDVINCVRDETGKEYNLQELINILMEQQDTINKQQAEIEQLKDNVYDELDKALKVLEEIYDDYPKNNVHRLYNNLKGLKEMIK